MERFSKRTKTTKTKKLEKKIEELNLLLKTQMDSHKSMDKVIIQQKKEIAQLVFEMQTYEQGYNANTK